MRKNLWKVVALAAVLMMSVLALTALAQEKKSDPAPADKTTEQMMPGCAMHADMKACSMKGDAKGCCKQGDMKACSMKGDAKGCSKHGDMKACSMKASKQGGCRQGEVMACGMKGEMKGCCRQGDMKACSMKKGMGKDVEGGSTEDGEKSD